MCRTEISMELKVLKFVRTMCVCLIYIDLYPDYMKQNLDLNLDQFIPDIRWISM